jgi:hypothetical protein
MRRPALALLSLALVLGWLVPATAVRGAGSSPLFTAASAGKKSPTPVKKHKHKKHKPAKHKATPRPRKPPTPRPKRTKTPVPAVVNTAVPTPTATLVPTPSATPTPLTATMPLQADIPAGYSAGFYVCGLPSGATASFAPNPATARGDASSPTNASAQTTVTVSIPNVPDSRSYGLTFYAYVQSASHAGGLLGGYVTPKFADLTVAPGSASLQPADAVPADNGQGCSATPLGYQPTPLPTLGPSDFKLTTWVSDAHPTTGETVTVYAQLTQSGRPVGGAAVNFAWYSYAVTRAPCNVVTDATGTASCSVVNSHPLAGVPVSIEATAYYNSFVFTSWTSYTM